MVAGWFVRISSLEFRWMLNSSEEDAKVLADRIPEAGLHTERFGLSPAVDLLNIKQSL